MNGKTGHNSMKPHTNLLAWQKSMDLVVAIYETTTRFPKEELYGLVSQIRRAAVSVPSNIAEGAAGRSREVFRNHLSIAIGSLNELLTQIDISCRVGYLDKVKEQKLLQFTDECLALAYGLRKSL